ncbi:MAG: hypothetical protein ABIU96_00090 [Rhodanobacter sp.]
MSVFPFSSRAKRLRQSPVSSTDVVHGTPDVHAALRHGAEHARRRRRRQNSSYTTGTYVGRSDYSAAGTRQRMFRVI